MKTSFLTLYVLIVVFADRQSTSQRRSLLAIPHVDSIIQIKARLLSESPSPMYCGIVYVREVYDFQVLEVNNGGYEMGKVKIRYSCPREMGDGFFKKGKTYYIKAKKVKGEFLYENIGTSKFSSPKLTN